MENSIVDLIQMRKQLTEHEGLKLKAYKCPAGKTTIGVGRNLDDVGISKTEAALLLENDIHRCIAQLSVKLPEFNTLDEIRKRVLIDMVFNMGINRFMLFKNTLEYVKTDRFDKAAAAMLESVWAEQVGRRALRLAKMMLTGKNVDI